MTPRRRIAAVIALVIAVTLTRGAFAQGFRAVTTRDGTDAMAVGDNGDTYRTLNGGLSWTEQVLGSTSDALNDVQSRGFTFVVVTSSGLIWRTSDSGGNWTSTPAPNAPVVLHAVALASDATWFVAGNAGTLLRSTDAGATWTTLPSGTSENLNAIRFTDDQHGFAVGDHGTLLATADGGDSWASVSLPTQNSLLSIDQSLSTVWVVGTNGTAFESTDGGATFDGVNLKLDARADVRVVRMESPTSVFLGGGGGFIRYTSDGGATWTFPQHKIHAPISGMSISGTTVFAANSANRVVTYSTNNGTSWNLPQNATMARSWGTSPRYVFGGQVRGSSFGLNPVYKSTIYCGIGPNVMRSRDDGDTWQIAAAFPTGYAKCNAFIVSPKDSNLWVAALGGASVPQRIYRTTNGGTSWTTVLQAEFGEYGIPIEMDPDHPDTLLFGGELSASGSPTVQLQRSMDFGQTWASIGPAVFRSPCDLIIVPDSPNIVIVADGVTGAGQGVHWKSTDYGATFTSKGTTIGTEIPGMCNSRLRPGTILSTNWSSGGVQRSTNTGETWVTVDNSLQTWGNDVAKDDPNVMMFGQYSGSPIYTSLSLDGGATFTQITLPNTFGNNYSFYLRDRGTILAEQSSGIWKLATTYAYTPASGAQALTLTAPSGGETWAAGTQHSITWASQNVPLVRVEYRRSAADPWLPVANVAGYVGTYVWTVPYDATSTAQIRVSDIADGTPSDLSGTFTITAPVLTETPPSLDFGTQPNATSTVLALTLKNDGNATLHVTSITTQTSDYAVGRTTLDVAAGSQDTVGVWFMPPWGGTYPDTVTIVSDDPLHSPVRIPLTGQATGPFLHLTAPNGGEQWQFGSVHDITWSSDQLTDVSLWYRANPNAAWVSIATTVPAASGSYAWSIPDDPTTTAIVRIASSDGAPADSSHAVFSLTASAMAAHPDSIDLGVAQLGGTIASTVEIDNPGTGPLTVSSVGVGEPEFWVGRTSFVVPPGSSDTLGIYYQPADQGADTTVVTLTTDDPSSPHTVYATARASENLAVAPDTPLQFGLAQNRPNPFGRSTTIQYALPHDADVSLEIFDLNGQRVTTLTRGRQAAGVHHVVFARARPSGGTLPAGVYFVRLQAGTFTATRKMLALH